MRSTYLAIFGIDPSGLAQMKENISTDNGRENAQAWFEKKLAPIVDDRLRAYSEKDDISWYVFNIMTSNDFFEKLDPNQDIPFSQRISIDLLPNGILMPDSSWKEDYTEKDIEKYKDGYIFVFFTIDN